MGEVIAFPERAIHEQRELALAAGAEMMVGRANVLTLCPEPVNEAQEYAAPFMVLNADSTPWLREIRSRARADGLRLYQARHDQLVAGDFSEIILDVDAVGTAAKAAKVKERYGENSPEHRLAQTALRRDCSRKWAEAFRKNKWERFDTTEQEYDPETDQLYADGFSVDDMIDNGISVVAEAEELGLRYNDKVNHHTAKEIIKTTKAPITTLRMTPCPEWAHESLKKNPKSAHGGYAPEIDKFMLHFDVFDPEAKKVLHEQVGLSGKKITPEVMQAMLADAGLVSGERPMSRTEIHATLAVLVGESPYELVDILRLLDEKAEEAHGETIFLGEVVSADYEKDYNIIYTESAERRVQQEALTEELAIYVEGLEARGVDHALATVMVEKFIQDKMLEVAEQDPEKAAVIFDKPTAERFQKAREMEQAGLYSEAAAMRDAARKEAPQASSCGAGSCGLESVQLSEALIIKLDVQLGDTVVRDMERPCVSCGDKAVIYVYNSSRTTKYCMTCEAREDTKAD